MELQVRGRNLVLSPTLVQMTRRRMNTALHRLESRVRRVDVRLADLNGPRGGVDQRCRVALQLRHEGPEIVAEATDARIEVAIDRAATRVARRLHRLEQRRTRRLRRPRLMRR